MPKAPKVAATSYRYDPIAGPSSFRERLINARTEQGFEDEDDDHADDDVASSGEEQDDEDEEEGSEGDLIEDHGPSLEELQELWNEMEEGSDASSDPGSSIEDNRPARGYLLRVSMMTMSPPRISRILRVPAHLTFLQLHAVLQKAFSWSNSHAWKFTISTCTSATSALKTLRELIAPDWLDTDRPPWSKEESAGEWKLSDVFEDPKTMQKGIMVEYLYDFGDMWEHFISFMGIADDRLAMTFGMKGNPELFLISGEGAPCVEDCGGHSGHEGLKPLYANPRMPDPSGRGSFGRKKWDPWNWNIDEVNKSLLQMAANDYKLDPELEDD